MIAVLARRPHPEQGFHTCLGSLRLFRGLDAAQVKAAKLGHLAAVEDVDYRTPRGLDRAMFMKRAGGDWIRERP